MKYFTFILFLIFSIDLYSPKLQAFSDQVLILYPCQKWKYLRIANGKIYGYNIFTVKSCIGVFSKKYWLIEGEGVYKYYQSENVIDTYTENISFWLTKDYKLLRLKSEVRKNGYLDAKWDIDYKNNYYNYCHDLIGLKQFIHKRIPAPKSLCFYDAHYPWSAEIMLKNKMANLATPFPVLTFKEIETIELAPENKTGKAFLVNEKTRILVDDNLNVSEIQNIDNIVCKTGQEISDLNVEARRINDKIASNVCFIRPELLNYLHLKIKEGINFPNGSKTIATLDSPRQIFKGMAQNDGIDGEVVVTAKPNPQGESISFPIKHSWNPILDEYLKADALIESNQPPIIAKAREITAGSETLGVAVYRIAEWVHKNIQYQNVSCESALETLTYKKGVCRNISRLTVAFCRAVNIPARCIIGIFNYDQSFQYHAWVEVFFGEKDGWVAMDPTLGQLKFVDASHIGLTDVTTNWQTPDEEKKVEVLDYQPSSVVPVIFEHAVDLGKIWQAYQSIEYDFLGDGNDVGLYSVKLDRDTGQQLLLIENFEVPNNSIKIFSQLTLTQQGFAIHFKSSGNWLGSIYRNEVDYGEQISQQLLAGEQSFQKSAARISQNESQVEGFSFFEWGLVLTRLIDNVNDQIEKKITVYMPDIQRYTNIEVTIRPAEINFLGMKTAGMDCEIKSFPYSRHILLTKEGIITQLEITEIGVKVTLKRLIRREDNAARF